MTDSSESDSSAARIAFLRGLRAVRQLRPDPLPESVLHDILEVARWSGSAGNRQPWEFVVVRDRDLLRRLSAIDGANAGHLASAAAGIAIVIHPEVPDLDAYDEGRLAERILLAAAAQGVGAAVGHFTGPGDTWAASAEAKRMLGIPSNLCCARRFRWDIQPSTFSGRPIRPVESHSSSLSIGNTTDVYIAKRQRRCVAVAPLLGVEANPRHAPHVDPDRRQS